MTWQLTRGEENICLTGSSEHQEKRMARRVCPVKSLTFVARHTAPCLFCSVMVWATSRLVTSPPVLASPAPCPASVSTSTNSMSDKPGVSVPSSSLAAQRHPVSHSPLWKQQGRLQVVNRPAHRANLTNASRWKQTSVGPRGLPMGGASALYAPGFIRASGLRAGGLGPGNSAPGASRIAMSRVIPPPRTRQQCTPSRS